MNLTQAMLLLAALPLLAGCSTKYASTKQVMVGGYSDLQVSEDTWIVTFKGNNMTRYEKARDFALLRASELCLENGYSHFLVEGSRDGGSSRMIMMPTTATTTGVATGSIVNTTTRVSGGPIQTYEPLVEFTIRGLKNEEDGAIEASRIAASIRAAYNIPVK